MFIQRQLLVIVLTGWLDIYFVVDYVAERVCVLTMWEVEEECKSKKSFNSRCTPRYFDFELFINSRSSNLSPVFLHYEEHTRNIIR